MPELPVLIYDGECDFCRYWIDYWKLLTGERVAYAPYQEVARDFPSIPLHNFQSAAQLILPSGEVYRGAEAVFRMLARAPDQQGWLWLYEHVWGFAAVSEAAYRRIAAHRSFFYHLTRFFFGARLELARYALSEWLFIKALGIIYCIAFASLGIQITGLIGSRGILPVADYLRAM